MFTGPGGHFLPIFFHTGLIKKAETSDKLIYGGLRMIGPENVPTFEIHETKTTRGEMRQHARLSAPIPLSYQVSKPESEETWQGEGRMKDISFGGALFPARPLCRWSGAKSAISSLSLPRPGNI
jgi:hypothetical protein